MKKSIVTKIITLDDVAARDGIPNVTAWILEQCKERVRSGQIKRGWDGKSVEGEAVKAFVNQGRWGARCKVCGNAFYVSPSTPILYCYECGNGGSDAAYPVEFPVEREEIERELLIRDTVLNRRARNEVEAALYSLPVVRGLGRSWMPGTSVADLREQRETLTNKRGEK